MYLKKIMSDHVDNFDQFKSFIKERLTEKGDFFQLTFMTRTKDGHEKSEVIGFKYIRSVEDLDEYKEYIINKCISRNARCYIKINKRNDEIVSAHLVKYILDKHLRKEYHLARSAYNHAVATAPTSGNKLYIVDVDDLTLLDAILEELNNIKKSKRMSEYEGDFIKIKTKNGVHILVPPFHIALLTSKFKDLTVHKDAESLLFY